MLVCLLDLACEFQVNFRVRSLNMAASKNLMLKLDSETRVIQQNLLAHVHKHLSVKTQAINAEVSEREGKWGQERDFLQGQIAKLMAENARLKGDGVSRRGKCSQRINTRKLLPV